MREGEERKIIRILTQNTGCGEPRSDDSRQAAVMSEGQQSANGLPSARPRHGVQKLFVRGEGARGWGQAAGPGSFSGQWLCYLRSLSGLIGPRHDTRAIVNNRISPNWELGKIHLSQKCYIIEHQQQMQIVHCVLNKHWSIFWLPVLLLLSIFDDVGYPR